MRVITILNKYLNPLARLGNKKYSLIFPLLGTLALCFWIEFLTLNIFKNPAATGIYAIILLLWSIAYFSFRDGIIGGLTAVIITIGYYFYIIFSRHYSGSQLNSGIGTTLLLGAIYFILALIIGGLKEIIDGLIEKEMNARRLAQEGEIRLQTILDQLPIGVLLLDKESKIFKGNIHMEKLLGHKAVKRLQEDVAYQSPYGFKKEKGLYQAEWPIIRAITKGEKITVEEIRYISDKKKQLILKVSAAPILNTKQEIIAAVSTLDDITQEKEIEQRKDDFISMASHELKTPLTSVKVFTQLLKKRFSTSEDTQSLRVLEKMDSNIDKLTQLIRDLLDVSKIQQGKLESHPEKFFVRELVEDIIEDMQPITQHKLIKAWNTKLYVMADKERIRQVVVNLITNAIKYSPHAKKIIIGSRRVDKNIEVYVQDFGIGIDSTEQKNIFLRFYQAKNNKTYPGLGLGLYISYEIIQRNGGKLWVESKEGEGSIFYFTLPIYQEG